MPKGKEESVGKKLRELEKLVNKVIRKSLKDNTLDYNVQISISNMEPGQVKYAAQISAPAKGVQPITFIFDDYDSLEESLKQAEKEIDRKNVELTFHKSRINTYKTKIEQHEGRIEKLNDPDYDEDDEIDMEEVGVGSDEETN